MPPLKAMVGTIRSTLGPYTSVLVGVMAFLETGAFVGLLVPGETVVIVGGAVAGQGHVDVVALVGLTWLVDARARPDGMPHIPLSTGAEA